MSDTPRSDAASLRYSDGSAAHFNGYDIVTRDFARTLERELTALKAELEKNTDAHEMRRLHKAECDLTHQCDQLRAELETAKAARDGWKASFQNENARYQQACRACDEWIARNRELLSELENCPLLFTTTCNVSEKSWINRARAAIANATRSEQETEAAPPTPDVVDYAPHEYGRGAAEAVPQPAEATPETIAVARSIGYWRDFWKDDMVLLVPLDKAQQLEKERNAARLDQAEWKQRHGDALDAWNSDRQQLAAERTARQAAEARLLEALEKAHGHLAILRTADIYIEKRDDGMGQVLAAEQTLAAAISNTGSEHVPTVSQPAEARRDEDQRGLPDPSPACDHPAKRMHRPARAMTTPALCIVGNGIELRHRWTVRKPIRCKRCGCLLVQKKAVGDKHEQEKKP